jgi:hypothetical protein
MATVVERYTMAPEYPVGNDTDFDQSVQAGGDSSSLSKPTNHADLPRAASYTYFPQFHDPIIEDTSTDSQSQFESFSLEGFLPDSSANISDSSSSSSGDSTPDTERSAPLEINGQKPRVDVLRNDLPKLATSNTAIQKDIEKTPTDPVSQSLTSRFRRRSWLPTSRSPSPAKAKQTAESPVDGPSSRSGAGRRPSPFRRNTPPEDVDQPRSRSNSLSRRLSNKLRKRPSNTTTEPVPTPSAALLSAASTANHLPKSFSTDKLPLPTMTRAVPTAERIPQIPRNMSKDKLQTPKAAPARKRDELWTVFRNLDGDFQKYVSSVA